MKNSIFKSFRFEIVLYSLLSLVYTILTEATVFFGIYLIYHILQNDTVSMDSNLLNNNLNSFTTENFIANNMYRQPVDSVGKSQGFGSGFIFVSVIVAIIVGIILFITYFLILTKKFVVYLEEIERGITELSTGNFNSRIKIKNEDEFALIASKLNKMADDIKSLIENDRKNENTKNELITSVAHDLRTPLTSVIGYLELVSDKTKLDAEVKQRYVEIAYHKSKHLEKLIEDLFAYTKFTFGEVTLESSHIDMVKFMNQLVDEFYPSFVEFGLDYEFITQETSAVIYGDGNLLARAFGNLISNAIKYGKDGKRVEIKLQRDNNKIMISVINYGKLISENDLERIFERFYRVESSRSNETGGTGLGLAIARSIIEMHNGTIHVKSDLNGTVFQVILDEWLLEE